MRYNIFSEIHQPVKLALLSTCITLSKKNEWNFKKAEKSIRQVADVVNTFYTQLQIEEQHLLPLVFVYEPSVWDVFARQHRQLVAMADKLQQLIYSTKQTEDVIEKFTAMIEIDSIYNEFIMANYNHMDEEEEILNEILWQYYSDETLQSIVKTKTPAVLVQQAGKLVYTATAA